MSKRKKAVKGNMDKDLCPNTIKRAFAFHIIATLANDYLQPDCPDHIGRLFENIMEFCADHICSRFADVDYLDFVDEYAVTTQRGANGELCVAIESEISPEPGIDWGTVECNIQLHSYSTIVADTIRKVIDSVVFTSIGRKIPLHLEMCYSLSINCKEEGEYKNETSYIFERVVGVVDSFPAITNGFAGASKNVIEERCNLIAGEIFNKGVLVDHVVDVIRVTGIDETLLTTYDDSLETDKEKSNKDNEYCDFYLRALMDFMIYLISVVYGTDNKIRVGSVYMGPAWESGASNGWEIHAALQGANMPYKEEFIEKIRKSEIDHLLPEVVLYDSEKQYKEMLNRMNN